MPYINNLAQVYKNNVKFDKERESNPVENKPIRCHGCKPPIPPINPCDGTGTFAQFAMGIIAIVVIQKIIKVIE